MDIYWYAPFDNADEMAVARHVRTGDDTLVVESLASRFGKPLPGDAGGRFELIRDLAEPAGEDGGRPTRLRRFSVAGSRAWRRDRLVGRQHFDLLHIHTFNMFTDWLALPALRRRAGAMVGSVHNVLPHDRRGPAAVEKWLHHRGYRAFDHIFVAHEHLRRTLVSRFALPAERVSVVPLPIRPGPLAGCAPPVGPREFLFFGTLRHNKGIPVLLAAISRIKEPGVRFRFAGRGTVDLERLVSAAAENDDRIVPEIGFVTAERKAELLSTAWAAVLPYTSFDAQSGVLQDAYSYSLPVVATRVGALGAAVTDEATGWTVEPDNAEDLASCLTAVAAAGREREQTVVRIREIAAQRTPERIAARLRAAYAALVT